MLLSSSLLSCTNCLVSLKKKLLNTVVFAVLLKITETKRYVDNHVILRIYKEKYYHCMFLLTQMISNRKHMTYEFQ